MIVCHDLLEDLRRDPKRRPGAVLVQETEVCRLLCDSSRIRQQTNIKRE
jgi:hypothetical protein